MLSDDDKSLICLHDKEDFRKIFGFEKAYVFLDYDRFNILSVSHPDYDFFKGDILLDIFRSFSNVYLILDLKTNYESEKYFKDRHKVLEIASENIISIRII